MLHWLPPPVLAFAGARPAPAVMPGDRRDTETSRARHALMLGYAAQRRRAAAEPADARYWKTAAPVALEKARRLRENKSFAPLP
jgi:hypothetical protein